MNINIDIDRLSIALHGVSRSVAEAAVAGLDEELRRRLGSLAQRSLVTGDLGLLQMGMISGPATLDPSALRALIAERLVFALSTAEPEQSTGEEP